MAKKSEKTRLGMDIGTNSIGWTLFGLDENGEIARILAAGARIFSSGRDPKSDVSANAARRAARQTRRQRDRYLRRRDALLAYLQKFGLMPEDKKARRALQDIDPYKLRARAVAEKIELHHLGRAIFHISQRRGFKSNRRANKESDGPVNESVKKFRKQIGGSTVGQFLASLHEQGKPVRARRDGDKETALYFYYPARAMMEEEFNAVWKKQAEFYSELTEDKRECLFGIIFRQRPLKAPIVGYCQFFSGKEGAPKEKRAPKALPSFQKFRILQDVNHLRYYDEHGEEHSLSKTRDYVLQKLTGGGNLTFDALNKQIKKREEIDGDVVFTLNLQDERRKELKGDAVAKVLCKIIPEQWKAWDLQKRDALALLLLDNEKDDDAAVALLQNEEWGLTEDEARACIKADLDGAQESRGRASLSAKAIAMLLPHLEKGLTSRAAESAANLPGSKMNQERLSRLPEYPKVLKQWCVPRKKEDEDNSDEWRIPNPTVHIALNQLRHVMNDIIRKHGKHGKPDSAVVELARDLPMGKQTKKALNKRQTENQNQREQFCKEIEGLGWTPSSDSILRMRLWHELADGDANDRPCVYCGRQFGVRAALSAECEVDHILPLSRTLDDGIGNKVLCCIKCNREKGNQTPHEAWGGDANRYAEILQRAENLWGAKKPQRAKKPPNSKRAKFLPDAMKKYDQPGRDFLARQLTDTQYIAKAAKQYLECVIPSVYVIPGRLTAILRRQWGLNNILGEDGEKTRSDHRHHAVDAAVVGATTRSVLNQMAKQAKRDDSVARLRSAPPVENFREMVENAVNSIIVSHKPNRWLAGQLHNEKAYGLPGGVVNENGTSEVVHRVFVKELNSFKAGKILNDRLRDELVALCDFAADEQDMKERLSKWSDKNKIRRVLLRENLSVIAVRDRDGKPYKAYKTDGNWAYEIYETDSGKWDGEVISTFDANQKDFVPRLQMVMRLHKNDMVAVDGKDGARDIYRVNNFSEGKIGLVRHFDAVPAKEAKALTKSPNELRGIRGRKIHISPAGFISDPQKNGG